MRRPVGARQAALVHLGLLGSLAVYGTGALFLMPVLAPPGATAPGAFQAAAYLIVGVALGAATLLSRRLPERKSSEPVDQWWTANFGAALALWVVADGVGLAGLILWLASGSWLAGVLPLVCGLGILVWARPSRF